MHVMRARRGRTVNFEHPVWEPLIAAAPEHVGDFMWMHEAELEDGTRIHAYKHWETRRYLHLDHGGRAFVYVWDEDREVDDDSRYEEVNLNWLLALVLAKPEERVNLLRQNITAEYSRLRWARSATKHRISRKRARHVLDHAFLVLEEPPPPRSRAREPRLVFLGDDKAGVPLEVIVVEGSKGSLLVIHAMELRKRYREAYEEVRRWQR
jgi:hypothetical protein